MFKERKNSNSQTLISRAYDDAEISPFLDQLAFELVNLSPNSVASKKAANDEYLAKIKANHEQAQRKRELQQQH